ncbi:SDR family NAD(P)-dependent oxidoreductase [Nocardiopsis tropica]|uniref:SDR family NAD(P)-dependent oxidoreductase n=1 Tax=Nocardiopsis tropica TaxID=109330 RepID=A0ABU7KKE9_9ACTN|nr:SDR family NAD(P)-dependent oxidoreductase [Nocardiopsis umidischolae]MEE2049753.1 SDR family NAD(P)-dependent oxidoreductase [Nocardiopsis umidischolae]
MTGTGSGKERVILLTGGGRGIGRAAAIEMAGPGTTIVLTYRADKDAAAETAGMVEARGGTAHAVRADAADEHDVRALVTRAGEIAGRLDALVCNAGTTKDRTVRKMPTTTWDEIMDLNLRGAFLTIREAIPLLSAGYRSSVVTIASVMGQMPAPGQANYAASKGGLIAMCRTLAVELAPKGIRVNTVSPGLIDTDLTRAVVPRERRPDLTRSIPLGRFGTPEEVAVAVRFLIEDATYMTGAVLDINGGILMR